jgi:hypothetical protein
VHAADVNVFAGGVGSLALVARLWLPAMGGTRLG